MKPNLLLYVISLILICAAGAEAESEFFEKFKSDYRRLDMDLLNNDGEIAEIRGFVYKKDVATFNFVDGKIHLLRYVDGRPTTAIFIGEGHAEIDVPTHLGRMGLLCVAKDSTVSEDFDLVFIRMADDFDLKLKELFSFEPAQLDWKMFQPAKKAQGEIFFRPTIYQKYDTYFQLLRSVYERAEDGYFWADFNRYVFSFDPNRPEEVEIAYEKEGGDIMATIGASFQRQERPVYADAELSNIAYPTTLLSLEGDHRLTGLNGRRMESGEATARVLINADSLKYVSLFLQFNMNVDSIYFEGSSIDFMRRRDFNFFGVILPEYRYQGDTVDFTLWYRGTHFDHFMPYVENPAPAPYDVTFTVKKGYNYYMPGMSEVTRTDEGMDRFTSTSPHPFNTFYIHAYASLIDTIPVVSDMGITLNFIRSQEFTKRNECFIPEDAYQASITGAFNYYTTILGGPINTFYEYIIPEGFQSMPGMIKVPQVACVRAEPFASLGGLDAIAGISVAKQWYGSLLRPVSDRETWTTEAFPEYLSLLYLQHIQGDAHNYYYTNLIERKDSLLKQFETNEDMPLAAGSRITPTVRINKSVWLLHMLRFLLYDTETGSDQRFTKFIREAALTFNNKPYTNTDVIELAEKYYGEPLDWFAEKWLYGCGIPRYDVTYSIVERDGQYFIPVEVANKEGTPAVGLTVLLRAAIGGDESVFFRQKLSPRKSQFELGPFDSRPSELVFNEFYSILSRDNVKRN